MNKRLLSKLEQGEGTTLMGKLFLTPRQRQTVLKWFLFSLVYLALQVLQDVVFSRVQVLGGCPDLVPGYLLLVCLTQGPGSGGLFALLAGVFRCLSGAVLGPVCMLVVPDFPAGDPVTAVAVGIVSGLAATGADQLAKQLKKTQ